MNLEEYLFLLKPLILLIFLGVTYSLLGIFVLLKRLSFFSDGIAHASVFSLAIAYILGLELIPLGILGGIIFSSLIYFLERKTRIYSDALIGLIFVTFLSLGIIIVSFKKGYQPELLNFFIGNILTLSQFDFYLVISLSSLILFLIILFFKKFVLIFLDRNEAILRGFNVNLFEYLFYLILGIATILGIKIVGIVLITALLILPPMSSSLLSRSFKQIVIFSPLISIFNIFNGFLISFLFNFPLSSSLVVSNSFFFFLVFILKLLLKL
jgi:zinc transport system permease protein